MEEVNVVRDTLPTPGSGRTSGDDRGEGRGGDGRGRGRRRRGPGRGRGRGDDVVRSEPNGRDDEAHTPVQRQTQNRRRGPLGRSAEASPTNRISSDQEPSSTPVAIATDAATAAINEKKPRRRNNRKPWSNGARGNNQPHDSKLNDSDDKPAARTSGRNGKAAKSVAPATGFASYWSLDDCFAFYAAKDPTLIRGKIRVLPAKGAKAFVTCDRGKFSRDVMVETSLEQNRALDGDIVFVELYPHEETTSMADLTQKLQDMPIRDDTNMEEQPTPPRTWQEDQDQCRLWNPTVPVRRTPDYVPLNAPVENPRKGRVVYVVPPKETAGTQPTELKPADQTHLQRAPRRTVVGTLNRMRRGEGYWYLLTPNNRALPQFLCPSDFCEPPTDDGDMEGVLYKAEYVYGSWKESHSWPPCVNVQQMGRSCNVEDETLALLLEHNVNHGDFPAPVLRDVELAVESGMTLSTSSDSTQDLGWRPTPEMYQGRRDYRNERIFTIDPTTAKDLDDALHIKKLPNGRIEIGVHIADVSHFLQPDTAVDEEARLRATTVYLVDRVIPMLPRPLCEIACSLNENVERLAFSCVWTMNMDGTLESKGKDKGDDVWYGKTVIKSCARLDYATAQNIIEGKVATGERPEIMDDTLWPESRRPTGGHTVADVAADVRLMDLVAKARRRLRFQNGAVALNGVKLAFQLDSDGETPMLCAPYPIRDSNRLVEEYMLLANYLVAQRLLSHAGGLALIRQHPPPLMLGMEKVVTVAKEGIGFDIDASSSHALQASLSRLGRECDDELVLQCVTQMLMTPMKPAEYLAAGEVDEEQWRHFALNIPYYTHFTSPIRRYPDVIVHRLLQATLDGEEAVASFAMKQAEIQTVSSHCNDKRMGSKKAQDRSDRVFLALYLRKNPISSELGVVLSVGEKTFTVFVPSLGCSTMLYLDEHKDKLTFEAYTVEKDRRIRLKRKITKNGDKQPVWSELDIKVFTKLQVSCRCKEKAPIDVKVMLEGPWNGV